MFFPPPMSYFRKQAARQDKLPHVEVTEEEFTKLYVASGGDPSKAPLQALVSRELGAYTELAGKMVKVKENDGDSHQS
jgi:hypothetical protein